MVSLRSIKAPEWTEAGGVWHGASQPILPFSLCFARLCLNPLPASNAGQGWAWTGYQFESVGHSAVSKSLQPRGLSPTRLFCSRNFPGNCTAVGSHSLLQGIFPTQGSNPGLLHCRQMLYHLSHHGSPIPIWSPSIIFIKYFFPSVYLEFEGKLIFKLSTKMLSNLLLLDKAKSIVWKRIGPKTLYQFL